MNLMLDADNSLNTDIDFISGTWCHLLAPSVVGISSQDELGGDSEELGGQHHQVLVKPVECVLMQGRVRRLQNTLQRIKRKPLKTLKSVLSVFTSHLTDMP